MGWMSPGRGRRILLFALVVAGLVGVTAALPALTERLSGEQRWRSSRGAAELTVHRLGSIDQLKTAFNEDVGKVRIYLLVSPT
jgi:hypothetical protein